MLTLLAGTACLENRVSVELFTQIHGDGSCTRRVEYRLERVDTNKGDARVAIRAEDDVLVRWHRFPSGEPWQVREERETGLHVIVVEALLPSPAAADGDFFRARAPRAQPARNIVSAFVDAEHGVYEYQEVLRDPSSPLAAARALSRAALKRDGTFAEGFADALAGKGTGPRESDVRRAFREQLAEPFAREITLLAERPLYGPRERRDLDELFDRLDDKQKDLAARLSALAPGTPPEEIEAAAEVSFNSLGKSLLEQLEDAGLPLLTPEGRDSLHLRATLVMPVPILRANACVTGDTATWEFEEEDLFGRGFEMKALASAP
ncbi:MAG TPA: hypothetical protein VE359_21240 [Vicinamibacteria bacterium]|nr:hypothetical protein [Vicinamibacteria bacterium]